VLLPGALDRVRAVRAQAFDGDDTLALQRPHLLLAGAHGAAVNVHGAGAAQAGATPESRAGEPQVVPQIPQQRHVLVAVEHPGCSVDCQIDHRVPLRSVRLQPDAPGSEPELSHQATGSG
jgi:hypothetical protein